MLGKKAPSNKFIHSHRNSLMTLKKLAERPSTSQCFSLKKIDQLLQHKGTFLNLKEENPIYKKNKVHYSKISNRRISKRVVRNPSIAHSTIRSTKTLLSTTPKMIPMMTQLEFNQNEKSNTKEGDKFVPYLKQKNYTSTPYKEDDSKKDLSTENSRVNSGITEWKKEEEESTLSSLFDHLWKFWIFHLCFYHVIILNISLMGQACCAGENDKRMLDYSLTKNKQF